MYKNVTKQTELYFARVIFCIAIITFLSACGPSKMDIVPVNITPTSGASVWSGSVHVQTRIASRSGNEYEIDLADHKWADNALFKNALEISLDRKKLFTNIVQGNADYVLDVWAYFAAEARDVGEMNSIWRLTRVKDRKVLVCDFVTAAVKKGRASTKAVNLQRETIQGGLSLLSDKSVSRISALPAKIRPSMGPVVTEDLQTVFGHYSKLREGMSYEEAISLLDPFMILKNSETTLTAKRHFAQTRSRIDNNIQYSEFVEHMKKDFLEILIVKNGSEITITYTTDAYELVFLDGKLQKWRFIQ